MSEFKVMNNDEIRDFCIKKDLKIYELEKQLNEKNFKIYELSEELNETYNCRTKLRNQLKQKENIIKEVREEVRIYEEQSNDETTNELDNYVFIQRLKKVLDKEVN